MTPGGWNQGEIRRQLERVLASALFARNERLSRFLRFVVETELDGRGGELKETVLGIEVFDRRPDYNPKSDATVRTEAGRLRSRLSEYYLGDGKADRIIIELPKGGYVPVFRGVASPVGEPQPVQPKRRKWAAAVAAVALVVLLGSGWLWSRHRGQPVTIAVFPFDNLNHDPAYDYLADGLTDELIRTLATFDGLAPRSRISSFALKGRPGDLHDAGRRLSVEYVVDGSVLRSGERLRIDAQLIRVRDDAPVWSGRFDRDLSDVIGVQDEISRAIVNNLRVKLGRGQRHYQTSAEAYDLYLHARALGFRESIGPFQDAIAKDPSFAPAYAGLAATYAYRSSTVYFDRKDEVMKMRAAADKAIELDPLLAEAQDALAMAYARQGEWSMAEKTFHRAIDLEPNRSETYGDLAMYLLLPLGRFNEALQWMRVAQRGDPLSDDTRQHLTWVLFATHRYDEAALECDKLAEPQRSECLGRADLGLGKNAQAVDVLESEVARGVRPGAPIRGYLAYAYAKVGRRADAEKIADADVANPFHQVLAYLGLGEQERAWEALERMAPQGPMRVGAALSGPELEGLRRDQRAKRLRQEVGLPE
jgi:TolB-like protein/Flp pilus assembly protein TadD